MSRYPQRSHRFMLILMGISLALLTVPDSARLSWRSQMLSSLLPLIPGARKNPNEIPLASSIRSTQQATPEAREAAVREEALLHRQQYLNAENAKLQEELRGLREMLHVSSSSDGQLFRGLAARVIAADALGGQESILGLDRGAKDGVRKGAGVLLRGACVGRIVSVARDAACMAPITYRGVSIAAHLADCRAEGVLKGGREVSGERLCAMHVVGSELRTQAGERVVTSGLDGSFPPGCLLGTVLSAERSSEMEWTVLIRPVIPAEGLKAVFILTGEPREIPWPALPGVRK